MAVGAVGAVLVAVLVAASGQSLAAHYTYPRTGYSSADYRMALDVLRDMSQPGDVVVGDYPWYLGYVAGYLPKAGLRLLYSPGGPKWAPAEVERDLGGYPRVWVLRYSPDGRWTESPLERALSETRAPAFFDEVGDSRVRLFSDVVPGPVASTAARLGDRVALLRHDVSPTGDLRPGGAVDLTLTWQALAPMADSFTVFTHILGPDGRVWGQQDSPPVGGTRPTSGWGVGEIVVDRYHLVIERDAPAGEFLVEVGLYLPSTGQRLPVGRSPEEADRVILGRFQVAP